MSETIKMSLVCCSLLFGTFFGFLGITAFVEYQRIQERCIYLEETIEQQTMLIKYLKGEEE